MNFRPLYSYLKVVFNITIPTFYRKIVIKNRHYISENKPTLIAMNHPNAFMDPIAFAAHMKPEMNFLARGDAFTKGLKPWLEAVGIIPIYRFMDFGREGMSKNDETFREVTKRLRARDYVIIFPEGLCVQERRLRPLKKGLARMAFGSMEELNDTEITVIPVAMNYQNDPSKFRHTLYMNIGEPIQVKDFLEAYRENSARTITQFTQVVQEKMKELLVHIENPANDELVCGIEEIYLDQAMEEKGLDLRNLEEKHKLAQQITGAVNALDKKNPDSAIELKREVTAYLKELKKTGVRDKLFREKFKSYTTVPSLLLRTILFVAGIPFWIFGLLTNYVPYLVSWKLTKKIVKQNEWFAAVSVLMGGFLFQIWYLALFITAWLVIDDWRISTAFIVMTFFCGWFSLHYSPFRKKLFGSWRMFFLKKDTSKYERLLDSRNKLVSIFKSILNEKNSDVPPDSADGVHGLQNCN